MKRLASTLMLFCLALPFNAQAADLILAQAANFMPVMKEIIPAFERETGLTVQATYTSTGKLYGQIINGAPFDVFLSADTKRPELLFDEGLSMTPFVYAKGSVVLWSKNKALCDADWKNVLKKTSIEKIALANPETAAYGTVAHMTLKEEKLWDAIQPKVVIGQTISQVFQFTVSGAADVGFCAYSYMFSKEAEKGCYAMVDTAPPVIQKACILKRTQHLENAKKFVAFLSSPTAVALKKKYGYK